MTSNSVWRSISRPMGRPLDGGVALKDSKLQKGSSVLSYVTIASRLQPVHSKFSESLWRIFLFA